MSKITIKVFKARRIVVNIIIVCMLTIVSLFAFLGSSTAPTSTNADTIYYNGNTNSKKVSLMVNVYWGNEYLDDMLKIFDKYNVKTTFFVGGSWAKANSVLLLKIKKEGHEIANHGYNHKDSDKLSKDELKKEIMSCHNIVKEICDVEMNLFAPPSGAINKKTSKVANENNYKTIMWTKDTIDWKYKDEWMIYSRAIKEPNGGDLILMHPTEGTVSALSKIIEFYQKEGFTLTTVSDNLS